jgi:hypothetical protein
MSQLVDQATLLRSFKKLQGCEGVLGTCGHAFHCACLYQIQYDCALRAVTKANAASGRQDRVGKVTPFCPACQLAQPIPSPAPSPFATEKQAPDGSQCQLCQAAIGTGMVVYVRNLHGGTTELLVRVDADIEDVKMLFTYLDKSYLATSGLRFIFAGRQLEDGRTLSDYHLQKGSTIHSVLRLRGD